MTFCLAIKVEQGLVAIADTRVTSGAEHITARKVTMYQNSRYPLFVMTSGLRAARDKALTYYDELLEDGTSHFDKLYKAVNALGQQIRRVVKEDHDSLVASGLEFNLYSLVGGQLEKDDHHKLYMIYPQGNWVEVSQSTPYFIIGASSYGKPLLDRSLRYNTPLELALKIGCLAFDSTRASATDVDFPMDVVLYRQDSYRMIEHRLSYDDLRELASWWQQSIQESVQKAPEEWMQPILGKIPRLVVGEG